jgi:hypothetical protein
METPSTKHQGKQEELTDVNCCDVFYLFRKENSKAAKVVFLSSKSIYVETVS